MMNKLKSIFIGLLAVCLLFSSAACGKNEPQPLTNPTAVETKAQETHERTDKELKASFDSMEDGSEVLAAYRASEIAFSNEAKLYGMDTETAALVTFKEGSFRCYVLNLKVSNTKKYDLTVQAVLSPDNGKNGVWVCGVSQYGVFDVSARGTAKMPVTVLVDGSVTAPGAVEKALRGMSLSLEYTDAADNAAGQNGAVGTVAVKM